MINRITIFLLALAAIQLGPAFASDILTVFKNNCVQCHGQDGKVKGKTNLLEIADLDTLANDAELLTKIIEAIDFQEMPPEDEPQLEPAQRTTFLTDLKSLRQRSLAESKSYPPAPIRRLNRFQYDNAIVDLFDLNRVVYSLPERMMREHKNYFKPETGKMADTVTVGSRPLGKSQMIEPRLAGVAPFPQDLRAEHGYDNQADHLSLSPLLMESFLKLGQSIVESDDFTPRNVGIWKNFFAEPDRDPKAAARTRLQHFLTRAFRRPVADDLLDRYTTFVHTKIDSATPFDSAMKQAAAAAISSPRFLYLYDGAAPTNGPAPIAESNGVAESILVWTKVV